jgi:hypothetical protein
MKNSICELVEVKPHSLKASVRKSKISLWKLRKALGGSPSETALSRLLNGIDPMDKELEERIRKLLEMPKGIDRLKRLNNAKSSAIAGLEEY